MHKTTILCQFGLFFCHQLTNSYLHQFSTIFGGNCIIALTLLNARTITFSLTDVHTFVHHHCPSNAADFFKTYLADRKTVKPHNFDCYKTRSHLELLNKHSRFLPGAGGDPIFNTDLSLCNAFFQLMLNPWQLKFTENGNSTEAPMTINWMVDFFKQQHIHYNAR